MMEEFTTNLYDDLQAIRRQMAQTLQDLEVNHKEAKEQAQDWKDFAEEGFHSVEKHVKVGTIPVCLFSSRCLTIRRMPMKQSILSSQVRMMSTE